jgi:hypothetical protein
LANGANKPVGSFDSKRLGLFRQPQSGFDLPVDSVSITPINTFLILCSFPEIWNGLVMVVCNYVSGSNTLKFDDVVGVILSEEM